SFVFSTPGFAPWKPTLEEVVENSEEQEASNKASSLLKAKKISLL
ncbi:21488_t:CDS:1, partial [Dentiscutata erythropus]